MMAPNCGGKEIAMKNNKKLFTRLVTTFLTMCLLCVAANAVGNVTTKTLNATYKNIKIVLNGVQIDPKDASGNIVEPFVSEGTTYLPVRAIANALGLDVKWDGETSTVYLGDMPGEEVNWAKKMPPYQYSFIGDNNGVYGYYEHDPRRYFSIAGEKHFLGYAVFGGYNTDSHYALWNTNLQYKSMTFTVGSIDGNTLDAKIDIYLDGEYSTSYDVEWDAPPKTITVPLNYSANLKIVFTKTGSKNWGYGMYDISFAE